MQKVCSLRSFQEKVDALGESEGTWLYRGQDVDERLLPKIGRQGCPQFSVKLENAMIEELKRIAFGYEIERPKTTWDWLALGQHHGLATRLLDWTSNPLVALYFAVECRKKKTNRVVWAIDAEDSDHVGQNSECSPSRIKRTRFYKPNIVTPRIKMQSGWFSAHAYNSKKHKFNAIERLPDHMKNCHKIEICDVAVERIQKELDTLRIHRAALFPDFDSLCAHLNRQHDFQ